MASLLSPPGHYLPDGKSFAGQQANFLQPLPTPPAEVYQPLSPFDRTTATVAAAVQYPPSMSTFPDTSFTARRPNAQTLPQFQLPPNPAALHNKFPPSLHSYSTATTQATPTTSTTLASVGNLLTPPSNSADSLSPTSGMTSASSLSSQPYTPNSWQPPTTSGPAAYVFSSTAQFGRGNIFSPSLGSMVRSSGSPTATEGLPPPPYELPQYSASMPMSAPSLPAAVPSQQHQMIGNAMMGGSAPASAVTQASPVQSQDAFARPPPTPTYYSQPSSTPQQTTFPYSTGPSPVQQSPISGPGSMPRQSPINGPGPMPPLPLSLPAYGPRPFANSYPPPLGPVLSNVGNPGGQLALVNGMAPGMAMPYTSGHAAMQQMYPHHPAQPNPANDRPFRCDQCPQSFNRNHDLKRHKRIHLAVKPFPCGHCDKSFSRKDALKRHVLVKGCGKAHATAEVKELDGSTSPDSKSDISPVITASA